MARTTVIREETIIDAARAVFLERGFRATTAEVADRAGVSEGSIFKRFKSKSELFEAAMGRVDEDPPLLRHIARAIGEGDVRMNLARLGLELIDHLRTVVPLSIMQWSNPALDGLPRCVGGDNPVPLKLLRTLIEFFAAEMRLGRLRPHDPDVAARAFLGTIHNYVVFDVLYGAQPALAPAQFVDGLLALSWDGLQPLTRATRERPPAAKEAALFAAVERPRPVVRAPRRTARVRNAP